MFKKINKKLLFVQILIPLVVGGIGALLGGSMDIYQKINLPSFAPPALVFPIAWTLLYILMGISNYLIIQSNATPKEKKLAKTIYGLQLFINCLWTLIFFRFQLFLFAFWWLILLILFVILMIIIFFKINKTAALLQLPYLAWIIFASVLNYTIYLIK